MKHLSFHFDNKLLDTNFKLNVNALLIFVQASILSNFLAAFYYHESVNIVNSNNKAYLLITDHMFVSSRCLQRIPAKRRRSKCKYVFTKHVHVP